MVDVDDEDLNERWGNALGALQRLPGDTKALLFWC